MLGEDAIEHPAIVEEAPGSSRFKGLTDFAFRQTLARCHLTECNRSPCGPSEDRGIDGFSNRYRGEEIRVRQIEPERAEIFGSDQLASSGRHEVASHAIAQSELIQTDCCHRLHPDIGQQFSCKYGFHRRIHVREAVVADK